MVDQRLDKVVALYYTNLNFIKKIRPHVKPSSRSDVKVLIYSQVNLLGGGFFH